MKATAGQIGEAFSEHRRHVWALCYRMTGDGAEADELLQETFTRALERPPAADRALRPWLVTVALNLSRDALRRRKRRRYVGPWLPGVVVTDDPDLPSYEPVVAGRSTAGRYELLESVSLAFLCALEALTPKQRAVLLLRDVFDYAVREAGEALGMTEGAVKTTLHRARAAMRRYDAERQEPSPTVGVEARAALQRFIGGVMAGDVASVEAMLSEDVVSLSDGGGEYHAARVPVLGRNKVARMYVKLARMQPAGGHFALQLVNGQPALVSRFDHRRDGAGTIVLALDVDRAGKISRVYSLLATAKVAQIPAPAG